MASHRYACKVKSCNRTTKKKTKCKLCVSKLNVDNNVHHCRFHKNKSPTKSKTPPPPPPPPQFVPEVVTLLSSSNSSANTLGYKSISGASAVRSSPINYMNALNPTVAFIDRVDKSFKTNARTIISFAKKVRAIAERSRNIFHNKTHGMIIDKFVIDNLLHETMANNFAAWIYLMHINKIRPDYHCQGFVTYDRIIEANNNGLMNVIKLQASSDVTKLFIPVLQNAHYVYFELDLIEKTVRFYDGFMYNSTKSQLAKCDKFINALLNKNVLLQGTPLDFSSFKSKPAQKQFAIKQFDGCSCGYIMLFGIECQFRNFDARELSKFDPSEFYKAYRFHILKVILTNAYAKISKQDSLLSLSTSSNERNKSTTTKLKSKLKSKSISSSSSIYSLNNHSSDSALIDEFYKYKR